MLAVKVLVLFFIPFLLVAQIQQFPFTENFDADTLLPTGWSSSRNRDTSKNDFTISTSSSRSTPQSVISTNATISQSLYSPFFDFSSEQPETLSFYERRTSTHNSGLLVEASTDSGLTYFPITDTLKFVIASVYVERNVTIPDSFAGRVNVRFRWRMVGDGTGTTGTIRFDDISLTTATQIDIAVTSISVLPLTPFIDDSIAINAIVKNLGNDSIQNIPVDFYLDANNDSLPQSSELFSTRLLNSVLHQNDSVTAQTTISFPVAGTYRIIVKANVDDDEDSTNNIRMTSIVVGWKPGSLVVNEIMYAPTSPEPEWVELASTISDSINLRGWKISDKSTSTRYTITTTDFWLRPNEFVVLTKDSSALSDTHPNIQHLVQLSSMPTLNNDSDAVVVFDSRGLSNDSVFYFTAWGGKNGRSLERIETTDSSNAVSNWGTSVNPSRSTPGTINSLTPKDFDLVVQSISATPSFPIIGDSVQLQAKVMNKGKNSITSFDVLFYEDTNGDSLFDSNELFQTSTQSSLSPGDSSVAQGTRTNISFGNHLFMVRVILSSDEDTTNNSQSAFVFAGYPQHTIIVNEIMFTPPSSEPEWIELYNNSSFTVDLKDWKLSNKNSSTKYLISNQHVYVNPQQFILVTKDAARLGNSYPSIPAVMLEIPTLPTFHFTNANDAVALFDSRNAPMDSVFYSSTWGGTNNRSLERLEPDSSSLAQTNWGTSTHPNRATPGMKNTLTRKEFDAFLQRVSFSPINPQAGDSVEIRAVVVNKGKQPLNGFTVEFYEDVNGDSLFSPSELFSGEQAHEIISPKDSSVDIEILTSLTVGTHSFLIRVTMWSDEDTINNSIKTRLGVGVQPRSVVINEIMYAPSGSEPEWIELYNQSNLMIDLNGWKISNKTLSSRHTIATSSRMLNPQEYIVLTKDTARFISVHPATLNVIEISAMPTFMFSNNGDAVVLYDNRGTTIDSVRYFSTWGGTSSYSLERIEATLSSNDSINWGSSEDSLFSTPAFQNSITPLDYDFAITRVFATTITPTTVRLNSIIKNVGRNTVTFLDEISYFYDSNGDSIIQQSEFLYSESLKGELNSKDTFHLWYDWADAPSGEKQFIVRITLPLDMKIKNNIAFGNVTTPFDLNSIIINEIMYEPRSGSSEYIELFNSSNDTIDLFDWKISDKRNASGEANEFALSKSSFILNPGEFVTIATDSSIFTSFPQLIDTSNRVIIPNKNLSLNNDEDDIILWDLTGRMIDSVRYTSDWHNALLDNVSGRSLERINPNHASIDQRNWSTSANPLGGTPGRTNSIFTAVVPTDGSLTVSPNPFSPDGDGFEDFAVISYQVPTTTSLLRVRLYDSKGRLVRTLAEHEPSGSHSELIWDGMNDEREKVPMGIYIILFEALDGGGNQLQTMKTVVVVAVKL